MPRKYNKRRGLDWNEQGFLEFNKQQTNLRWRLCKEALQSDRFSIKLKGCYTSTLQIAEHSTLFFNSHNEFDVFYTRILALGWGCKYEMYLSNPSPEGAFYPFNRFSYGSRELVDSGCIWIGTRSSYPRIKVENRYCKWYFPMNLSGIVIKEPFAPFREIYQYRKLLEDESFVAMIEQRNENRALWKNGRPSY